MWTLFIIAVTAAFVPLALRYGRTRSGNEAVIREDALRAQESEA